MSTTETAASPAPRPRAAGEGGFTLFEILVVLTIVGILYAVAAPSSLRGLGANAEAASGEIAAALRKARGRAIAGNTEVALTVDVAARRYALDGLPGRELHRDLSLALFTAQSERVSEAVGSIRYFPDGSSTGGEITVFDRRSRYRVRVDWLTGRTTILEGGSG